ncbi:MAG: Rsd/AlgQ family anti-sigma factor [Pseudomonadota bacterium]
MAESVNSRPRTQKLIEDMLQERQQVLVLYWELSKLTGGAADQAMRDTLEDFQEILVDYIAAGHFGLYQRLAEGTERRQRVVSIAEGIYPAIVRTTDAAVTFNEKYEEPNAELEGSAFTIALSELGEQLAVRTECEDQLIRAMLGEEYSIPETPIQ